MRDKKHVGSNKMFVADFKDPSFVGSSARRMATELLEKEFRGPGDTLEAAAYRLQTKYALDAEISLQGWRREIKEMKASRWLRLFQAWWAAGLAKADNLYAEERALHDSTSAIVGLADFVAGTKEKAKEEG